MLRLMKKVLSALIGAAFMASCSSSSYVQVVDMKGSVPVENSNFTYSDNACKITYNLWSNGGDAGFRVENLTDQVIYINLANSFFIENGTAHDYFRNRTYGKGSAVTNGKSLAIIAARMPQGLRQQQRQGQWWGLTARITRLLTAMTAK